MANCSPSKTPAAAGEKGELNCMSVAMLQHGQQPCCYLKWEVHSRTSGARWHSYFSAVSLLLACKGSPLGDALCQCPFHPSPEAACLCTHASCLPALGAVLLLVGKSEDLWCLVHRFSLYIVILSIHELIWFVLLQVSGGIHVFQMCLKANLHSSAFSSYFSYFLGTSMCCQFACLPILVELMPFSGQGEFKWFLPVAMLEGG